MNITAAKETDTTISQLLNMAKSLHSARIVPHMCPCKYQLLYIRRK